MIALEIQSVIRDVPDFPKPGIVFKDITPLLSNHELSAKIVEAFKDSLKDTPVDVVVGVESRGFLYGMMLANALSVPFVPIRKAGKLPAETLSYEYDLEYGSATVEIHKDAIVPASRVLIHDDLLATGGTAVAAAELVQQLGAEVAAFAFVVGLDFLDGKKQLQAYADQILTLVNY
jgi:adenine phosphoribosyltransferase